ncbi:MAG: ribonuclease H-like domain-containing protein [Desulfobacteraceae bacterium]
MLKNSFQHIPGIGAVTEKQLWTSGLLSWQDITPDNTFKISPKRFEILTAYTKDSFEHFNNNNPVYFADLLPVNQHWRLFNEFRESTAFIDIETTGIKLYGFEITTIALYDGEKIRYYIKDRNLEEFIDDIRNYNVIVTYNGKAFDVPFIEGQFGIRLNHAHIDLRYVLKSLGYSGGLKLCEKALGLDRGDLDGVDGYFAVLLWLDYQQNKNEKALETLLAYNIEDVVNLETLMVMAYNMKIKDTPFNRTHEFSLPEIPAIPFQPDLATIDKLENRIQFI